MPVDLPFRVIGLGHCGKQKSEYIAHSQSVYLDYIVETSILIFMRICQMHHKLFERFHTIVSYKCANAGIDLQIYSTRCGLCCLLVMISVSTLDDMPCNKLE